MALYDHDSTMKFTEHFFRKLAGRIGYGEWLLVCALLALAVARPAWAVDAYYINNADIEYPYNVSVAPQIDATTFINSNTFIMNPPLTGLYETSDTLNYTNVGYMEAYYGFQFEHHTSTQTNRTPSANFFNSGTIDCGVACLINATNIAIPGNVTVGSGGQLQITGENVDLTRSILTLGGTFSTGSGVFGTSYAFGTDTNGDWAPTTYLTTNIASSSEPINLTIQNPVPYFQTTPVGTNGFIVRVVFLNIDPGLNVTNHVYFGATSIGSGQATVEWVGTYLDAASGMTKTNYYYLNDDYLQGASTNVQAFNGIPDNFTFYSSTQPLGLGTPTTSGLPSFTPDGVVTNTYSYVDAQITASTVNTNSISSHLIADLPGSAKISAAKKLKLPYAEVTGMNYLSLEATNQFDGSAGATIPAPYSDISLGVTNGFLAVSNLITASIPNWNGEIQAWSGTWTNTDTNGINWDYRVLLVSSQLSPTSKALVQDLVLNGTNTVISDVFNVIHTFNSDAKNLTLTTNGFGVGAGSLDGELNLGSDNIFSGADSLPNLRSLTNNGAMRFGNLAQFWGSSNVIAVTGTPGVQASGVLSEVNSGVNVVAGNKVKIGDNSYYFVNNLTNSLANQVKIGISLDGTLNNLIAAINRTAGAGTAYSTNTMTNAQVTAGALSGHALTITAIAVGSAGNMIQTAVSTPTTNYLTWSGPYLTGGVDYVSPVTNVISTDSVPYDNFINHGLVSDQGSAIWANNFLTSGAIYNGVGSFNLISQTTTLAGASIYAGGDISLAADNLVASNVSLEAGRSLVLSVTGNLTDNNLTNGVWYVQNPYYYFYSTSYYSFYNSATGGNGLQMLVKPATGDLLGTTIYVYDIGANKQVFNVWAGEDRGISNSGYTDNAAVGRLILDAYGVNSQFVFSGAGNNNALYVDKLVFADQATNGVNNGYDFSANLQIDPGMMIYYASAVYLSGSNNYVDISSSLDAASQTGANNGRLRWVSTYSGNFTTATLKSFVSAAPPAAPRLSAVAGNKLFQLAASGVSGPAVIQASTNLVDWINVYTNTPPFSFTDPDSRDFTTRFYRTVPLSAAVQ